MMKAKERAALVRSAKGLLRQYILELRIDPEWRVTAEVVAHELLQRPPEPTTFAWVETNPGRKRSHVRISDQWNAQENWDRTSLEELLYHEAAHILVDHRGWEISGRPEAEEDFCEVMVDIRFGGGRT